MLDGRLLEDVAIHDSWLRFAGPDHSAQETVEHISFFLASSVVVLDWSGVDELRQRVRWANDLDREAVEKLGVSAVEHTDDGQEAIARRIIHHSSRHALNQIKSRRLRRNFRIRNFGGDVPGQLGRETARLGMGRWELKDLAAQDDFAERS